MFQIDYMMFLKWVEATKTCLGFISGDFSLCTMGFITIKPPFGRIFFTFPKHLTSNKVIASPIFPQTVYSWGSQCNLGPGSLGVGWCGRLLGSCLPENDECKKVTCFNRNWLTVNKLFGVYAGVIYEGYIYMYIYLYIHISRVHFRVIRKWGV